MDSVLTDINEKIETQLKSISGLVYRKKKLRVEPNVTFNQYLGSSKN